VAENTVLSASVLPTSANTDHTFAFTALLQLDSTMLAGGQAINFDFGDGTSQTAVTSDNGVALAAHQCAPPRSKRPSTPRFSIPTPA
jgi:hypothetical protein